MIKYIEVKNESDGKIVTIMENEYDPKRHIKLTGQKEKKFVPETKENKKAPGRQTKTITSKNLKES